MTESKIERVARAMCVADGGDPDRMAFSGMPEYGRSVIFVPTEKNYNPPRPYWMFYYVMASVAIAEMREPTQAMIDAGMKHDGVDLKSEYMAMIDEALKD